MNIYDSLSSNSKLEFITRRVLPAYLDFESKCLQAVESYHRKLSLCHQRYDSAHSVEEKKFYCEQVFRLFNTVCEEFKALQTGSYHCSHHVSSYGSFEHNRSKERYRYKADLLGICSIDGLQYELSELKSRLVRKSDEIESLQNQVDTFGLRYTEIYNRFMQSMADFIFRICGMRLEKPQDSLLERGIFKCQLQHEDQVATVTFIPKRTPCYAISSFLDNPVIEEYEGSSVHKVLNPQMVTRIQDDEVPSLHQELETDDSIHDIKEQYIKILSKFLNINREVST